MIVLLSILPKSRELKPVVVRNENEDQTWNKYLKLLNYEIIIINKVGFNLFIQYSCFVMETL